jgi:WW domain-containing oxidoreductase
MQFLVNHVSHFLLVTRLVDLVPDRTGRIVIVSSSASTGQAPKEGIMFDNLDGHRFYKPFTFYGQSKLATAGRGIAVNSVHPGATRGTNLNANLGLPFRLILSIAQMFMKSVAQGAATQVLLAASPLVEGITREYWSDCQVAEGNALLDDPLIAQRLWTVSERIADMSIGAAA